jgi:hypothetical protein
LAWGRQGHKRNTVISLLHLNVRKKPISTPIGGSGYKLVKIADGLYQKTADMGEGGVKKPEKLPLLFMDGPM